MCACVIRNEMPKWNSIGLRSQTTKQPSPHINEIDRSVEMVSACDTSTKNMKFPKSKPHIAQEDGKCTRNRRAMKKTQKRVANMWRFFLGEAVEIVWQFGFMLKSREIISTSYFSTQSNHILSVRLQCQINRTSSQNSSLTIAFTTIFVLDHLNEH